MRKLIAVCVLILVVNFSNYSMGQEKATPDEIVKKTREAATFLSQSGEAGLIEFNKKDGRWVWKDTYIFVYNCEKGTIAAHPVASNLIGQNSMGLKDIKGNLFFVQLCEAAKESKGDWVEYWWPKPGDKEPSRKVSLMLQVPDTPYQVGAGIYDHKTTIEELRKLTQ